jgi:hypothetical protein
MTRGTFVGSMFMLPGLAIVAPAAARADDAKASQSAVHYQPKPNGGMQCSKCSFFLAGQTPDANGTCKVVDGVILPNGYCIAYSPK